MTTVFLAQLLIPVLLVLWLCVLPPSSHLGWAMQLVATLELLAVATRVGIWMLPPWWTPYAAAALVLAAALLSWPRAERLSWLPAGLAGWAADLVATDALGLRTTGFMPVDPARYPSSACPAGPRAAAPWCWRLMGCPTCQCPNATVRIWQATT